MPPVPSIGWAESQKIISFVGLRYIYITAIHCKLKCILKLNKCIGPEIAGLKRTLAASVMTPVATVSICLKRDRQTPDQCLYTAAMDETVLNYGSDS